MLKEMLQVIAAVLLVVVLAILGTATKLETARTISVSGAVDGNGNFDGSGNVNIETTQANIAVLTGNFSIEATTGKTVKTIAYPSGYNKENCTVLSFGTNAVSTRGYSFGHHCNDSTGLLLATNDRDISLNDDSIALWYNNISTEKVTINYQIVLMKIS